MEIIIPKANLFEPALKEVLDLAQNILLKEKGQIQLTKLLAIINFPPEVNTRIQKARGNVKVECNKGKCIAFNKGKEVNENIPGGNGFVSLSVDEDFKCNFSFVQKDGDKNRHLIINVLEGLEVDLPGPINPDVVKIIIKEPNFVMLEIFR